MNVTEIVKKYLEENGYDGLCSDVCGCGCDVDDHPGLALPHLRDHCLRHRHRPERVGLEQFADMRHRRRLKGANAANAGVADAITFQRKPVAEFSSKKKYGCIVTNPPYGERMQDEKEVLELYREMGRVFESLDSWSYFIMTSSENFERAFGRKADKNRKLYNGMIRTYLYQYLGPLPPRPPRQKDPATAE